MNPKAPPKVDPTAEIWIGENSLFIFIVFMTVFGSLVLIPTAYIRWRHKRIMEPEVIFIVLGYAFFLAHELVLLSLQPLVYRLSYVALGMRPYYKEIMAERHDVVVLAYVSTYVFYSALWCIKISLLLFFRQFMRALPEQLRYWNLALGYLVLSFLFGFLATLLSCGGPHQLGQTTRMEMEMDAYTIPTVMIFPLRLVFAMHISRAQKIRAGALFSVGMLCMITSIIRLVQIGSKTGVTNPNVQWFSLWGTVEATTAIVVGCLPTFRLLFKARPGEAPPNYSLKVPPSNSESSSDPASSTNNKQGKSNSDIHLNTFSSGRNSRHFARGGEITASTENLAPSGNGPNPPAQP
ncbi:uncharacterized protein GIQ15_04771 [Arthroderma uncinatum]|uniref:uncharacterized protein n=1 Tax=Arthroderma uncinatum TaxID=74035 RepID=UPI00144A61B6|nr:uncharacterized protein GIQ15_04771 [Arthroderma uncinatum]KAF3482012.1 hypothetical protein GIQ15_04771 [Arthroderma uncinatum]